MLVQERNQWQALVNTVPVKMTGKPLVGARLSAFQEYICSIELVKNCIPITNSVCITICKAGLLSFEVQASTSHHVNAFAVMLYDLLFLLLITLIWGNIRDNEVFFWC
jgi:uncharacterized membrane protein